MDFNTWTNEYGDYVYEHLPPEITRHYFESTFEAWTNTEPKQGNSFASLKSAKIWLNKFRKAKKWVASRQ